MNVQQFLDHHGINSNPFAEEDAQTDPVFKDHCLNRIYHPTWDKIYGDPSEPATSLVFGEKGSGKTAMRLQILAHLQQFNSKHDGERVFVVDYDDFNPFLDRFRETLGGSRRKPRRALAEWKLWDHMDSILSLAVTSLIDRVLDVKQPSGVAGTVHAGDIDRLDRHQSRDLLLLAACYDHSMAETFQGRWHRLRRRLKFRTFLMHWPPAVGIAVTLLVAGVIVGQDWWESLRSFWTYAFIALGWLPMIARTWKWFWKARRIVRRLRVGNRETKQLRKVLTQFSPAQIGGQPLPDKERTDDRYELLLKLQGILKTLGFSGIIILVDRVDEPHLINGQAEAMQQFLWPLLDNKFLKHPGLGFKLLLPIELEQFLDREDREFFQRARLDKQNMVPSLEWTGEALFDVTAARIKACTADGQQPALSSLFGDSVSERRLIEAFRSLRVPRHLFKFLYRLFVAHCNAFTDENPVWTISSEMFESTLAVYLRDQDQVDRGLRAG
ncbi:MAG: hypothetical protein VB875_07935 [Pirellulales bacterium]